MCFSLKTKKIVIPNFWAVVCIYVHYVHVVHGMWLSKLFDNIQLLVTSTKQEKCSFAQRWIFGPTLYRPEGCLWGCRVWMSIGKCSLLRMISWFLPVNLLALLMLLVCQSVQYRLSSNTVMANGWGRPKDIKKFRMGDCNWVLDQLRDIFLIEETFLSEIDGQIKKTQHIKSEKNTNFVWFMCRFEASFQTQKS